MTHEDFNDFWDFLRLPPGRPEAKNCDLLKKFMLKRFWGIFRNDFGLGFGLGFGPDFGVDFGIDFGPDFGVDFRKDFGFDY